MQNNLLQCELAIISSLPLDEFNYVIGCYAPSAHGHLIKVENLTAL